MTMRDIKCINFVFASLFVVSAFIATARVSIGQEPVVFSTWEGLEVDKCASIWLIKRFIHENAEIRFYPKGEVIEEGIPFDTPEAEFKRTFNMSTFESFLRHYGLEDARLVYIGRIIHDIEINTWERKVMTESVGVQDAMNRIIWNGKNNKDIMLASCKYFDALYEQIRVKEGKGQ
jgi:hypothetical protein